MDPTARRRALLLKKPITRDSFTKWDMNNRSFYRQFQEYIQFLPDGTRPTWTAYSVDRTRGITIMKMEGANQVLDEEKTNKTRAALEDFLLSAGSNCPEHYLSMVRLDSTSYTWILDKLEEAYQLDTKGIRFLAGCHVKSSTSEDDLTYQQMFQAVHEHYSSSLLKQGNIYKGQPIPHDEVLTPLGDNIIVEKWLELINPSLKSHIMQTRGIMFTPERPNLSDHQRFLCDQMEILLKELEHKGDSPSVNRTGFPPQQFARRNFGAPHQQRPSYQPRQFTQPPRTRFRQPGQTFTSGRNACPANTCLRCYEAGRTGTASRTHQASSCPHPRNPSQQRMRILLIPAQEQDYTPRQQQAQIQEIEVTEDLLQ